MKLSTKAQYGLKACYYLAEHYGKGSLSVEKIAAIAEVPSTYLEQLMIPLKKADIVAGVRGAGGGYVLKTSPEKQSVGAILRVLEDNLELLECQSSGCKNAAVCPTCGLWNRLGELINHFFDGITLADLQQDYRQTHCKGASDQ